MLETFVKSMSLRELKASKITFNLCRFLAPIMFIAMAIYVYISNEGLPIFIPIIQTFMGVFAGFVFHLVHKKVTEELNSRSGN